MPSISKASIYDATSGRRASTGWASGLALLFFCLAVAIPARAQLTLDGAEVLATFSDARRLAADPLGNLYVADPGARKVVRLSADGVWHESAGGALIEPSGIDPTNGLVVIVSDRATGDLLRFSRSFAFVGTVADGSSRRSSKERREDRLIDEAGDVAVGAEGELFVIDQARRAVIKLNARFEFERRIGDHSAGALSLEDPVAMCFSEKVGLRVADQGRQSIVNYDAFGAWLGEWPVESVHEMRSIHCHPEGALVVTSAGLLNVRADGDSFVAISVQPDEHLVDALVKENSILVLTSRRLYRVAPSQNTDTELNADPSGS